MTTLIIHGDTAAAEMFMLRCVTGKKFDEHQRARQRSLCLMLVQDMYDSRTLMATGETDKTEQSLPMPLLRS